MDKNTGKNSNTNKSGKTDYADNREEFAKDNCFGNDKNSKSNKSNKSNCK